MVWNTGCWIISWKVNNFRSIIPIWILNDLFPLSEFSVDNSKRIKFSAELYKLTDNKVQNNVCYKSRCVERIFNHIFCRMIHKAFFCKFNLFPNVTFGWLWTCFCTNYVAYIRKRNINLTMNSVLAPWGERYEKESSI